MAKDKDKKNATIVEGNEVTEETVRAEEEQKAKEEQERKEKAYNIRKEKIKKTFDKLLKGHDINLIVKIMMWVFFAFSALYVNANIFKQVLREPALKVFIAEDSLKDESIYNINEIKEIRVNLESFDVDIRETDSEDIIIRYSKKYDKKINMDKRGSVLQLEEKNKVFKLVRFDTSNNLMIIEIPNNYGGSLEIESKNGMVKIDKYKTNIKKETEKENTEDSDEEFYKKFFNI